MSSVLIPQEAIDWIVSGDTGASSKAIWATLTGAAIRQPWYSCPVDADDFGRCYRLLKFVPGWRERLPEMSSHGANWAGLVKAWPRLEALYEDIAKTSYRALSDAVHDVLKAVPREGA